jgi:hypothetical protein
VEQERRKWGKKYHLIAYIIFPPDVLATGYSTGMFAEDEKTNVINQIRYEVKQAGLIDDNETCWKYLNNN